MRSVHLKKDVDLLRALIVLQEDAASEAARQETMARRLRRRKMNEKDEDEKEAGDAKPDAPPSGDKPVDKEKVAAPAEVKKGPADDDKLPGADRLESSVLPPGKSPTSLDIAQRVNFIRAGASLKDPEVKRAIAVWIAQLREPERLAAYTALDALAQIILGGKSPAEAPTFEDPAGLTIKGGEASAPAPKRAAPAPAKKPAAGGSTPITVGEGAVRKLKEVDVPVRSGRVVPFGSKSHIADISERIEDLRRIRSYQEKGSDTHHALGVAIAALKKQLHAAQKSQVAGNPRTQPIPPLVEKEK